MATAARRWLHYGLGVKRWLLLLLPDITGLGPGCAHLHYVLRSSCRPPSLVWRTLNLQTIYALRLV